MTTKLLAVDDSKTMRKVLEITFAGITFDSTVVGSANDALDVLRTGSPDIAVVDGSLGSAGGYDLCKQIKTHAPTTRVLLLSSKQRPYDEARGSASGVDDHFDKPFDSTKFLDKLSLLKDAAPAKIAGAVAPAAQPTAPVAAAAVPRPTAQVSPSPAARPAAAPRPTAAARPAPTAANPAAAVASPASPGRFSTPAKAASTPGTRPVAAPKVVPTQAEARVSKPNPAPPANAAVRRPPAPDSRISRPTDSQVTPSAQASMGSPIARKAPASTQPTAIANGEMTGKLKALGLTADQVTAVLALSQSVVEQVVWEVVPVLAETLIKEEIARLTRD